MSNLENQLREAYFTLWAAVENGIDNDNFFELRATFRGIQSLIEEDDKPVTEFEDVDLATQIVRCKHYYNQLSTPKLVAPMIMPTGTGPTVKDLIESGHLAPVPRYSPECFDGRFFKWDGYVLDSITEGVDDNIMALTRDGKLLGDFHFPPEGYENDQEQYLCDALSTVKNWIDERDLPAIVQSQNC